MRGYVISSNISNSSTGRSEVQPLALDRPIESTKQDRGRKKASQVITFSFRLFFLKHDNLWLRDTQQKARYTKTQQETQQKIAKTHLYIFIHHDHHPEFQDTHPATAISTRFLIPHFSNISCCEVSSPNAALNVNGFI